jgi:hypothetical protein
MPRTKNPSAPESRIVRKKSSAPRAARKRSTLAEEAIVELAAAPAPVVEAAPPEPAVAVDPPPPVAVESPAAPVPWTPPRSHLPPRAPWMGLDGRRLVRAAARRVGREIGRRFPLLGRAAAFLGRFRAL